MGPARESTDNCGQAVEPFPRTTAPLRQLSGRHSPRVQEGFVPPVIRFHPPAFVYQATFPAKPLIQRCSRNRLERVEVCQAQLLSQGKIQGAADGPGFIVVIAEKKRAVDHDPGLPDAAEARPEFRGAVPPLAHLPKVAFVQRLETDYQALAAAAARQLQDFRIIGNAQVHLARPA